MFYSEYPSPLGLIRITATDSGLCAVSFTEDGREPGTKPDENEWTRAAVVQLTEYFEGRRQVFDLPLTPAGTAFQQSVWAELVRVPFGKTDSYSSIANKLNNPLSVRAVGAANGRNPIAIMIPCHRIIGANGSLTGYAGGLWRKEFLLRLEGIQQDVQGVLF